jgi:hypothetical protein
VLEKALAKKLGGYKALSSLSEMSILLKLTGIVPEQLYKSFKSSQNLLFDFC